MEQTASELAVLLEGQVVGNPETRVRKLAKIESAGPGSVSFLSNPEYERFLYNTAASVVIVAEDFQPSRALPTTLTLLRVADPYRAFARLLEAYDEILKRQEGIHPSAIVDADASIGEGCFIGPGVVIERGAVIGDRVELHAHVTLVETFAWAKTPPCKVAFGCWTDASLVSDATSRLAQSLVRTVLDLHHKKTAAMRKCLRRATS